MRKFRESFHDMPCWTFHYVELPFYTERISSLNLIKDRRILSCVMFAFDVFITSETTLNCGLKSRALGLMVPFYRMDYVKFKILSKNLSDSDISVLNVPNGCVAFTVLRCHLKNLTSLWVEQKATGE